MAALILHYTQKGPDKYGCKSRVDPGGYNVLSCTREMAACNVMPALMDHFVDKFDKKWAVPLSCNEAVSSGSTRGRTGG
jgi:hypothetical protein